MYVRSDQFLIARTTIACPRCSRPTEVIGLVLPPGHETDESDEADDLDWIADAETSREAAAAGRGTMEHDAHWMKAAQPALLFLTAQVSPGVEAWLHETAKHYERDSAGGGPPVLTNHCVNCGSAIDDQDLYSEPGHAFLPASAVEASKVSLTRVDQPIEATVDGYVHEPEFFDFMTRL